MDPQIYLSFTTVRRHLSGDVSALMRIHRFLELHGLINFNVDPERKPVNKELLRESCYDKVLINAANKHFLQKSENEYIHTLFDAPESVVTQEQTQECLIDPGCLRKINILTAKERPTCNFCQTMAGFTWFASDETIVCDSCFKKNNYPETGKPLIQKSISAEYWNKIDQDLTHQNDPQASKPPVLSAEQQT